MSVPKKRRTSSSVGRRRSHHALKQTTVNSCPQCKKAVKPHQACSFCGYYKKAEAVKVKKIDNKSKKK
jgi:large subunit ribosomal protein L32